MINDEDSRFRDVLLFIWIIGIFIAISIRFHKDNEKHKKLEQRIEQLEKAIQNDPR